MIKKIKTIVAILFLSLLSTAVCYSKSHYFYYDTREIPQGFSLLGMNVKSFPNINYIFSSNNLPDGFMVFKNILGTNGYSSWQIFYYDELFGGWNYDPNDTNAVINHGEAVYVYNPSNSIINQVIIGDVVQNSTTKIKKGFNLISAKTLKTGGISTVHGLSPNDGDQVYKRVGNSWSIHTFEDGVEPQWLPSEPVIVPFEGFWYNNANNLTFDWNQTDYLPNVYNSTDRRTLVAAQVPSTTWFADLYCVGTKLNTESMITFSYSSTLVNPNWNTFSSYGPGLQPNDENYTGFWAAQFFTRFGYIRVSTW